MELSDSAIVGETRYGVTVAYTTETKTEESVGLVTLPLQVRDESDTIVDQITARPEFVPGDRAYRGWVEYLGSEEIHSVTAGEPELALPIEPVSVSPTVETAGPPATIAATNGSEEARTIRLGGALVDDGGTALVTHLEERALDPGDRATVEVSPDFEQRSGDIADAVAYAFGTV